MSGFTAAARPQLRRGLRLTANGDSITARADSVAGNVTRRSVSGYLTWVNMLTRQRFYSPPAYNFGVNGQNSSQLLAALDSTLAVRPDVAIVAIGTNDVANGVAAATTTTKLTAIWDRLYNAGAAVIAVPILGRSGDNVLDATELKIGNYVNQFIREAGYTRDNFFVADCGLVYDDPTAAAWQDRSGVAEDGLHSNNVGAYLIGNKIAGILNALFPDDWHIPLSNASDLYDVTNNPVGNLCSAGMMLGTSGTVGGEASGEVATGWVLTTTALGGATAVASKSTFADGRVAQQLALSGAYTGTTRLAQFAHVLTAGNFAAGDIVTAECEIDVADPTNILNANLYFQAVEDGTTYQHKGGVGGTVAQSNDWSGILKTPPRTITATPSSAHVILNVEFVTPGDTTAIAGTIKFGSVAVRKAP